MEMFNNHSICSDKQAICIQCHNNPEMINYIISCLPIEMFDFYIHVDKKSDITSKINHQENVNVIQAVDVRWGRFSQVEATLKMFELIAPDKYNRVHLISGVDFPIKSPKYLHDFFLNNPNEYIQCNLLPGHSTWAWGGVDRYSVYYPQWMIQRPSKKIYRLIRVGYREVVMRTKIFRRRSFPVEQFYGGSSWFSITGHCLGWMMNYIKENPEYINLFKHGVCVDEVFFSTLVHLSPFAENIQNNSLRFTIWGKTSISGGPRILHAEDIPEMLRSKDIFARKFDNIEIIEKVKDSWLV